MNHSPLLYLVVAAVAASVFGSSTSDLAKWAVCAGSEGGCDDDAMRVAKMMATFVSTVATFLLAALVSLGRGNSERETAGVIVGAIVGAGFAILEAAEGVNGYPEPAEFIGPMIVYVGVATLVFGVLAYARITKRISPQTIFRLIARFATALFAGLLAGLLLQFAAEWVWRDPAMDGTSSKFIIAVVAPVVGTAAIGSLMVAPTPWGRIGTLLLLGFAVTLAASYTWFVYLGDDAEGWVARSPMSPVGVGLRYSLILLAGSLAVAVISLTIPRAQGFPAAGVATGVSAAIASWAAYGLGLVRVEPGVFPDNPLRLGTPYVTAIVMALSAGLGTALAFSANSIADRIGQIVFAPK
ncbi:hypothetical protein [Roseobacter sp. S98]|uniref:hypothetical protein n=1 Tax=Roseobacter algicola (ex Choi et al. 2025) (nom. illeg.) TaxID=3092138 RepID=UPI0035C77015